MIDVAYGKYILTCDGCGEPCEPKDRRREAMELRKELGWTRRAYTVSGKNPEKMSCDYCPVCQRLIGEEEPTRRAVAAR